MGFFDNFLGEKVDGVYKPKQNTPESTDATSVEESSVGTLHEETEPVGSDSNEPMDVDSSTTEVQDNDNHIERFDVNSEEVPNSTSEQNNFSENDILSYLSEKLGEQVNSIDDLKKRDTVISDTELDPELKDLIEWKKRTGRSLSEWSNFQKDYSSMSNLEVAREYLQLKHPDLTVDEVNLDLQKFIPKEFEDEEDVALKNLNLKKFASEGKSELEKLRLQLSEMPKSNFLTDDQKRDLDFSDRIKKELEDQKKFTEVYNSKIKEASSKFSNFPISLDEGLSINYNLTDADKSSLPELISKMPHWYNPDGSTNHQAIVKDASYIKNRDTITKMAYQQGIAKGRESVLNEANNSTLSKTNTANFNNQGIEKKTARIETSDPRLQSIFGK